MLVSSCSMNTSPIREPGPSVTGTVVRQSMPAADLHVELRTPDGRLMASTHTADSGGYGIQVDASGAWEIKAVGNLPGDFDSIVFDFAYLAPAREVIPSLDVYAYGGGAIEPADSATAAAPTPIQPLTFQWAMPGRVDPRARVQCLDAAGNLVWLSSWLDTTQVAWNGLENQGAFAGHIATPGSYTWRMKFGFPDSSEGHSPFRSLRLE
jgi:hypothetical protein